MNTSVCILSNFVTPWQNQTPHKHKNITNNKLLQDSNTQKRAANVPQKFIWSLDDDIGQPIEKMNAPIIDLEGFIRGDEMASKHGLELIKVACSNHGFFQVINHGIEPKLINESYDNMGHFFNLPNSQKARALKKPGNPWGLSVAHADRLTKNLPWKETLSFPHNAKKHEDVVVEFFTSILGTEYEDMGSVYQKYCNEMYKLSLTITELVGISLGVDRFYYRDIFEDARSIMRLNYYPPCDEPNLVLGTGPHCDPTSITVLYQDHVGGLQVFVDNKWKIVEPLQGALVINIGDTFMSCLHRAVVNDKVERKSMAFFLCPPEDKVLRPPIGLSNTRKYPDFT
ncbi:Gibberellin 20 oxidase 3, partial [Bienertia sinuspersici]